MEQTGKGEKPTKCDLKGSRGGIYKRSRKRKR
jgi:hypothetical protein